MSASSLEGRNTFERQILINVGNRFVTFGQKHVLPTSNAFNAEECEILPRVPDESEIDESRTVNSINVSGMKKILEPLNHEGHFSDFELISETNERFQIDLKIKDHDPKLRDIENASSFLDLIGNENAIFQVWFLNIERLKLVIMQRDKVGFPPLLIEELEVLDVWEKTPTSVFARSNVVHDIDIWKRMVANFYEETTSWFSEHEGIRFGRSRSVVMAEELMQRYAVPDYELEILDLLKGEEPFASFVPRGLWLVGAWGRIDVITTKTTHKIIGVRNPGGLPKWNIVLHHGSQRLVEFSRENLFMVMN